MKKLGLHWQILIAILLGGLFGFFLTDYTVYVDWMGDIFMRALKMIVVPLIFCSVTIGVANISAQDGFARLGSKTIAYYLLTCLIAILTGLLFVNLIKPGIGIEIDKLEAVSITEERTLKYFLINMIPDNIFAALSSNNMIGIIIFAMIFGVFLGKSNYKGVKTTMEVLDSTGHVIMKMTLFILKFAPLGVFGIIAAVIAKDANNLNTLSQMIQSQGLFFVTVFAGLCVHMFITLSLFLYFIGGVNPLTHLKNMKDVLLMAFSTASSNATLPLTMEHMKTKSKIPSKIANFTLPLGATINMDGTSLYECVAVIFIAQAYGIDLSIAQQALIIVAALMVGIGSAGIPMASLVMTVIVIQMVGLPEESIALILLFDRFLDMGRTTVNVYSDTVCTVLVAKNEPED